MQFDEKSSTKKKQREINSDEIVDVDNKMAVDDDDDECGGGSVKRVKLDNGSSCSSSQSTTKSCISMDMSNEKVETNCKDIPWVKDIRRKPVKSSWREIAAALSREKRNNNSNNTDSSTSLGEKSSQSTDVSKQQVLLEFTIIYLDTCVVDKFPVIRVFGRKRDGVSVLAHVHGCLPYMFVKNPCSKHKPKAEQEVGLQKVRDMIMGSKYAKYFHDAKLCRGVDFYGYKSDIEPEIFIKIELNNAFMMRPLQKYFDQNFKMQAYEVHFPYLLQFLSDYELAGMGYLRLNNFTHIPSHKKQTLVPDGRNTKLEDIEEILEINVNVEDIVMDSHDGDDCDSSGQGVMNIPSLRGWLRDVNMLLKSAASSPFRSLSLSSDRSFLSCEPSKREILQKWLSTNLDAVKENIMNEQSHVSITDAAALLDSLADEDKPIHKSSKKRKVTTRDKGNSSSADDDEEDDEEEEEDSNNDIQEEGDEEEDDEDEEDKNNDLQLTQAQLNSWDSQMLSLTEDSDDEEEEDQNNYTNKIKESSASSSDDDDDDDGDDDDDDDDDESRQQHQQQVSGMNTLIENDVDSFENSNVPVLERNTNKRKMMVLKPKDLPPSYVDILDDQTLKHSVYHQKPFFSNPTDSLLEIKYKNSPKAWVPANKMLKDRVFPGTVVLRPKLSPPSFAQVKMGNAQDMDDILIEEEDKGTRKVEADASDDQINLFRTMLVEVIAKSTARKTSNPKTDHILCIYCAVYEDIKLVDSKHIFRIEKNRENEIFEEFAAFVHKTNPDCLGGWEIQRKSVGYILERACVLGMNDFYKKLSRVPNGPQDLRHMNDSWGESSSSQYWLAGRIVLNVWRAIRGEIKLNSYSFENVTSELFNHPIPVYSSYTLYTKFMQRKTRHIAMDHLVRVVQTVQDVILHLDFITKVSELSKLLGMDFFSTMTRGSQYRVESVLSRIAKNYNYVMPSPTREQVASQPSLDQIALNLEPRSAMYCDPVAVLDFRSLYPSVIISHNLCYSTLVGKLDSYGNLDFEPGVFKIHRNDRGGSYPSLYDIETFLNNNDLFITNIGTIFVKDNIRRGMLPIMLDEILSTRFAVKDALKVCHAENKHAWKRVLDARQLALKLLANVTYGYTAASFSGRMPMSTLADTIVSVGKKSLEMAMTEAENENAKWMMDGCPNRPKVVYGDTDSLFVLYKNCKLESAFKFAQDLASKVTQNCPPPMKLQMEKLYMPCFLVAKKRYCGMKFEKPTEKSPKLESKGLENIRRDSCKVMKDILNDMIKCICNTKDLTLTKKVFERHMCAILENKVPIKDFIFASKVKIPIEKKYRGKTLPPSAKVAKVLANDDPMKYPVHKQRVQYVVTVGPSKSRLTDMVEYPSKYSEINALYYIKNKILKPLDRIFKLVKVDVTRWYQLMRKGHSFHRQIINKDSSSSSKIAQTSLQKKKSTLLEYYASESCYLCKNPVHHQNKTIDLDNQSCNQCKLVKEDNSSSLEMCHDCMDEVRFKTILCDVCQMEPQSAAVGIAMKDREIEYKRETANHQCTKCTGDHLMGSTCENTRCKVFYDKNSW